jgi:phosphotransferase system  glucose/maltose/N-acetylglucosamine-specific IIC component
MLILSPAMTNLTNLMFLATFLTWTGAAKFVYAGWFCKETDPVSGLIATQRKRYLFALFGQAILVVAAYLVWHASGSSINQIEAGMHDWLTVPVMGQIVYGTMYALALSPLVTLIVAVAIFRKPAAMARKNGHGYMATVTARGYSQAAHIPASLTPVTTRGDDGRLRRAYVPTH